MLTDNHIDKPAATWLLTYLPDIYQGVEFMPHFLRAFESIWDSFDCKINHLDSYFNPYLTPAKFLPWLSTWVGLALDETLSEKQKRESLGKAIWLFERQGTATALRETLRICVNAKRIEIQTHADNSQIALYHFRVMVHMPDDSTADPQERTRIEERVKRIVEQSKPAYAWYDAGDSVKWPSQP